MGSFSKLRELSLPYNCYEVGHTWTPECSEAALMIGYVVFIEGMKIYGPLYLVSQALQRKYSLKEFWNTIHSIYTSSCFLAFNGFAFIFIFCLLRKSMGKFYYLHCSYFPAFMASFLAILIERKSRRGPLALYVTNVASETIFRMAVARGKVKPIANGEVYLFSTTMAFFLYIIRKRGFSKDFISLGMKYLIGKDEARKPIRSSPKIMNSEASTSTNVSSISVPLKSDNHTENNDSILTRRLKLLKELWKHTKHRTCPHDCGCVQYIFQRGYSSLMMMNDLSVCLVCFVCVCVIAGVFVHDMGYFRPFILGYAVYATIRCMILGKKIFSNPAVLWKTLTQKRILNLGCFLGGFTGTFRIVNCLLRWTFGVDREVYAIPAAFLGGLFMQHFRSSTLALYLTWKLVELAYLIGMQKGYLPEIKGSMLILYACSTAVLFYAAVLEPHNLKPAYLKFLNRITHNRIQAINRHVLDIFGTHASKLYSNFWPDLDLRYCSRVFQESVLLWLIH